jgi:prophage antirepressor
MNELRKDLQLRILEAEDESELLEALLDYEEQYVKPLENKNRELSNKASFYDTVTDGGKLVPLNSVAKILKLKRSKRRRFYEILRELSVIDKDNKPKDEYIDLGYFRYVCSSWIDGDRGFHIVYTTLVYPEGVEFLRELINKHNN